MKKAFWICLVVYLVGVALMLAFAPSYYNLRVVLDPIGLIAIILGVLLLGRWLLANGNSLFNARPKNDLQQNVIADASISQEQASGRAVKHDAAGDPSSSRPEASVQFVAVDKRLIGVGVGAIGAFFIASGFQTNSQNWAGQVCYLSSAQGVCLHPEWIAVGAGLLGLALYLWTLHKPSPRL